VSSLFNPQEFFQSTAYFASKGRGLFTITATPKIFENTNDDTILAGLQILKSGISAKQFSIPQQSLATSTEFSYIGPTRKMPYNQQFSDLSIEFLLTNKTKEYCGALYYTLKKWQEQIAGPIDSNDKDISSDITSFGVSYYNEYTTRANAKIFTPSNDIAINVDFSELYPLYVGALTTSWESDDSPAILPVQFTFHYSQILKN